MNHKSITPVAARLDPENIQPMRQWLHHLVAKAPWSGETLLQQVRDYVSPTTEKQGPVVAHLLASFAQNSLTPTGRVRQPRLHGLTRPRMDEQ